MIGRRHAALAIVAAVVVGACSGEGTSDQPSSTATRNSEPSAAQRTSDGILRLGVLLPPETAIDEAQRNDLRSVLEAAGRVIDTSGPPWIDSVEIIFSDESADVGVSRSAVEAFLADGVDALIGPVSSDVAGAIVRDVTAAGVGVCSPASTSVLMSKVPDDGLLIRTSPADDDIARAMSRVIDGKGYGTAAVFYPDTEYGREFFDLLARTMLQAGQNLTAEGDLDKSLFIPYELTPSGISQGLSQIGQFTPRIALIIGDQTVASDIAGAFPAKNLIVNDGFAGSVLSPEDAELLLRTSTSFEGFAIDTFDGVDQTISSLKALDAGLVLQTNGRIPLLASYVDCLNVLVLSSVLAGSDLASDFMSQKVAVTTSGSTCRTFVECIEIFRLPLNFDYDGWGKKLDLDEGGQVVSGPLLVFGLDPSGTMSFRAMHGSE